MSLLSRVFSSPTDHSTLPWYIRRRRRTWLAAALAALGLGLTVLALMPRPAIHALAAARDLPAGHQITEHDLQEVNLSDGHRPAGTLGIETAVGARLVTALRRGELLTETRIQGSGLLAGAQSGLHASAVQVPAATAAMLQLGDTVRVVTNASADTSTAVVGPATVLAETATVLGLPGAEQNRGLTGASFNSQLLPVVLALTPAQALKVAGIANTVQVNLLLVP